MKFVRVILLACLVALPVEGHYFSFTNGWNKTVTEIQNLRKCTDKLNRQWPVFIKALNEYRLSREIVEYRQGELDTAARRKAADRALLEWSKYEQEFSDSYDRIKEIRKGINQACAAADDPE